MSLTLPVISRAAANPAETSAMQPAAVAGDWDGIFDFGNNRKARVAFRLMKSKNGENHLRIDLIDKSFWGIPASVADQTGKRIRFEFAVIDAKFEGELGSTGDMITGVWTEGGYHWPASFSRHSSKVPVVTQPIDHDYDLYLKPQQMIRLESGRSIHLVCVGRGSPTVILTAGNGFWSDTWRKIQKQVAVNTRVCSWDRAGFGFSDPSVDGQDVLNTTDDLDQTLRVAGVKGPYIMVGHSLGSNESLLYKDRYPSDVVGMVLIEPAFPDQYDIYRKETPSYAQTIDKGTVSFNRQNEDCVAYLRQQKADAFHAEALGCFSIQPFEPVALTPKIARLDRDVARSISRMGFYRHNEADGRIIRNPFRNYGNMPLAILMARD